MHSNLPLKVHYCTSSKQSFEFICLQMIIPNKHRIYSFHISDRSEFIKFFTLHTIDSSFHRLESLILHGIKSNEMISFLPCLTTLPHLFLLNISLDDILNDLNEIYRLIFRLPMLKYNKLSAGKLVLHDSIPTEQFSSIEQLIINHPCTLHGLYDILSYTPKLRRLTCANLFQLNENLHRKIPLRIFNLTYCSIQICYLNFNEFEIFIKKISSQLRILHFSPASDIVYLDADRWERLISQHMPYLHTFHFEYSDIVFGRFEFQSYHSFINRFTSSFWIEKGWIFDIQTDLNHWPPIEIIYSIKPHKYKRWYDLLSYENNKIQFREQESMDISRSMSQLTIRSCHFEKCDQWFIDYIRSISSLTIITSLYIEFSYFSIDILVQFLHLLPHLDSLTIIFMISNQIKQIPMIHTASIMNKITKVNIEQMVDLNRVDILINLCHQMEYLQVQCTNYNDLESIIRLILMKRKSNLSSLCFYIPKADDLMVKNLQTMIYFEKFLINYTIQRLHNRIYLHWQKH